MCLKCLYPTCTNPACPRCPTCLEESCQSKDTCKEKPKQTKQNNLKAPKGEEVDRKTFRCRSCTLRVCKHCNEEKCNRDFAPSSRDDRCKDCLHPSCMRPECRTCKTCRDPACARNNCTEAPQPLPSGLLKKMEDVATYECDGCFLPPCTTCRTSMPANTQTKKRKSPYWKEVYPRSWLCQDCEIKGALRQ